MRNFWENIIIFTFRQYPNIKEVTIVKKKQDVINGLIQERNIKQKQILSCEINLMRIYNYCFDFYSHFERILKFVDNPICGLFKAFCKKSENKGILANFFDNYRMLKIHKKELEQINDEIAEIENS